MVMSDDMEEFIEFLDDLVTIIPWVWLGMRLNNELPEDFDIWKFSAVVIRRSSELYKKWKVRRATQYFFNNIFEKPEEVEGYA